MSHRRQRPHTTLDHPIVHHPVQPVLETSEDTTMPALPHMIRCRRPTTLLLILGLLAAFWAPVGWAQVDPGMHTLHQNDRLVGLIFVPSRDTDACTYVEHWFLFDDYRYPSPNHPVRTTLRTPDRLTFETLDRLARGAGHWVTVEATEERSECR